MELRVLKYFIAVAQEQNITKAANYLHITQPTLSRQLMELEEDLGTKLLNRGKRNQSITLTEEGMILRKRAEEIIELTERTESELSLLKNTISGDIYIGGGETDGMRLIAKTAKCLQKEYPNIRYNLYSGNADDVKEKLDKGLLDFGILIGKVELEKYNYMRLPATDTWGLLMQKNSDLSKKDFITPEDLKDLPLLISRQTLVKNVFSEWLTGDFEELNIVGTYNLIYNASLMVDEGFGYALTLDKLVNVTGDCNLCFKTLKPGLESQLNIVWKKNNMFTKAAAVFLEKLKKEFCNET